MSEKAPTRRKRVPVSHEFVGTVRKENIAAFAKRNMGTYATEVNLSRSVPDLMDGLKPVQRRIMWEAFLQSAGPTAKSTKKTARIVGGVIGRWHPHGDASVEGAVTTMVHHPTPTMMGIGNFGGLLDPAAAMRYTNCGLSNYGLSFFQSEYINKLVTGFSLNYDDLELEPISLPAMLPNVLLNGGEGIGVGVTTSIPTFTPESVVEVLTRMLEGEKLTPLDFAKSMKYRSRWGGKLHATKENRQAWVNLFRTGSSSIQFKANLVIDRDAKALEIDDWPPGLSPTSLVNKVRKLPETERVYNHEGDTGFRIEMRSGYNYTQFDKYVEKIQRMVISRKSFKINVTYRKAVPNADGQNYIETRFLSVSIPKLLQLWLKERLQLEKRSLEYRIDKQRKAIDYSKLLIYAASKLEIIFKALRSSDPKAYIVKGLKITEAEADLILDLKVRQLSKLDADALKVKLDTQEDFMKTLQSWYKAPRGKVANDLQLALEEIRKDRAFEASKSKQITLS